MHSDETDAAARERAFRRAGAALADGEKSFTERVDELLSIARDAVDTDFTTLSRVDEAAGEYVFERVLAPPEVDLGPGDTTRLASLPNCAHVVETGETHVVRDVESDAPARSDPSWGIRSYLGAPVTVEGEIYGTVCFYGTEPRLETFSQWDVTFVEILADWIGAEVERERSVDQVARLTELYGVVRELATRVMAQATREEVETTACRRLAEAYESAWIGDVDPAAGRVDVRAAAGIERPLVEDLSIDRPDDDLAPPARAPSERP